MPFIILLFFTALLLEGMGTYISIIGLSQLFAGSAIILLLMGTLDLAKIVTVSFVYRYWKKVNFFLKTYMLIAVLVTMTITSTGAFSYLSRQFQEAYVGTQENTLLIDSMTEEQSRLQLRKEEIDKQISQLPPDWITARTNLNKQFGPEVTRINERLAVIDAELPTLKSETLHKKVEVGPILFIAAAFQTSPEEAIKWIILTIILVFDPLAIALLIAGNFLVSLRQEKKEAERLAKEEANKVQERERTAEEIRNDPDYQAFIAAGGKAMKEVIDKNLAESVTAEQIKNVYDKEFIARNEQILEQELASFESKAGTAFGPYVPGPEIYDGPNHLEFEDIEGPSKVFTVSEDELARILKPKSSHVEGYLELNEDEDLGRAGAFDGAMEEVEHLTDEELDGELGRSWALDNPLDEVDHLTDEELYTEQGKALAPDDDEPDVPTARPVITREDLNKSVNALHRSALEDEKDNGDVKFYDNVPMTRRQMHPLAAAYQDDDSLPTVQGR